MCKWDNAWLGKGYYFWDSFMSNAHWWGKMRYNAKYIICQAYCDFGEDKCFDLVGSTEHMSMFSDCVDLMEEKGLITDRTTVTRVLNYMIEKLQIFKHEAIRAYGINSISQYEPEYAEFIYRLKFEIKKPQYLDIRPAIQLCIFSKKGLNLREYKIVFPDEYIEDFAV